jgi:hypothetical protein
MNRTATWQIQKGLWESLVGFSLGRAEQTSVKVEASWTEEKSSKRKRGET